MDRDAHYWLRCGNCGQLITAETVDAIAYDFHAHADSQHGRTNVHLPRGGRTNERGDRT